MCMGRKSEAGVMKGGGLVVADQEMVYGNLIYFSYAAEMECHISCYVAILCQSQAHKR